MLLILLILTSCGSDWKVYQPLVFVDEPGCLPCCICEAPDIYTDEHRCRIIAVFDHYGVEWKEQDGDILIPSGLDEELIWNFTSKATGANPARSSRRYDAEGILVEIDTLVFDCTVP